MTIDERLERLTDRQEGLMMTVEIVTRDIQDLKHIAQQSLESINALARIAESHDRRIGFTESAAEDHEQRITRLEDPSNN